MLFDADFVRNFQRVQIVKDPDTMRPFLSMLCSALYRIWAWLFCGATFVSDKSDGSSARLPLLATKEWRSHLVDDVKSRSKGHRIASSQTGELHERNSECLPSKSLVLHQRLYQQFAKPLAVPVMHGAYNWGHHFELPQQGRGCVIFTADCSNDVHIAISPQPQSMDPMYELVIGGWSNTSSVVRRRSQGANLCTAPVGLNKPRFDTVNDLWVSVDKTTRFVRIGQGREPSLESMFCIYKDLQFLSEAQYVCFTTWNVPATYSNVMVMAME